MPKFIVIECGKPPDTEKERLRTRLRAIPKPKELLQCPRCGCREMIEARTGAHRTKAGRIAGGVVNILCADCLRRGERVAI